MLHNKHPDPILSEEWGEINNIITTIGQQWDTDFSEPSNLDHIINRIEALFKKRRCNKKEKKWKSTFLQLASTTPENLPETFELNDLKASPPTQITHAWIGSTDVLGFIQETSIPFCYDGTIFPITAQGTKIQTTKITGLEESPFIKAEVLQEGVKGAHDPCLWAIQNKLGNLEDIQSFLDSIVSLWDNTDRSKEQNLFIATAIRLAKTKPEDIPGWNGKVLHNNLVSIVWTAANKFFGAIWNTPLTSLRPRNLHDDLNNSAFQDNKDNTPAPEGALPRKEDLTYLSDEDVFIPNSHARNPNTPPSILKSQSSFNDSVPSPHKKLRTDDHATLTTPKKTKFAPNPYNNFSKIASTSLSTGRRMKKPTNNRTILRARIPIYMEDTAKWNEMTNNAIKLMHNIWKHLLLIDPSESTIEQWNLNPKSNAKPLRINSTFPSSKAAVHEKLIEDLKINWINSPVPTDLRFILGHKKKIKEYMENKELIKKMDDLNIELFVDRIQSEKRTVAGYLAGPVIRERSAELIADILIKSPVFVANNVSQLDIFEEVIIIRQGPSKKFVKRTRAMHIWVSDEDKALARTCLASAYPSKVRGDYPLGIQFRFVPNTADPDFAVPPSARTIASRLKAKQASFLDRRISRQNRHFKDIFALHEFDANISLLKILMSLKSKRFPERQLFTCIEQDFEDGEVYFQYSEELEDEADGVIPVIPLFLEGQFGKGVKKWIKPSATIGTQGYKYDKKANKVTPDGKNPLMMVNQDWHQRVEISDDYSLSDHDSDDDLEGFAIEFGELDLANGNRTSNLGDDSESLGTMGLLEPDNFREPEEEDDDSLSSEQQPQGTLSEENQRKTRISRKDFELLSRMKQDKNIMKLVLNNMPNTNTVSSKQDGDGSVT